MLGFPLFVQIYDGYFIHYFAPRGLPPVEKNVVFVIDVSGSMFGTKMQQVTRTPGPYWCWHEQARRMAGVWDSGTLGR